MQITIHLKGHYDWEPVPEDVVVTDNDLKALRVKPGSDGKMLMRVNKTRDTHTSVHVSESSIIGEIIAHAAQSKGGVVMNRAEAMAAHLALRVMPHHAHRKWMTKFEIHDSGPEPEVFKKTVQHYVDAGMFDKELADEMLAVYMKPADHKKQLHNQFNVPEEQ